MATDLTSSLPQARERLTVAQHRKNADAATTFAAEPEGIVWSEAVVGGVPGLWADSENGNRQHIIQYLHGGGHVAGSAASHRLLGGHIAKATGCRVLLVDFRLAPEAVFPASLDDSVAVYRALLAANGGSDCLAIGGDSAGGGLALSTLLRLRHEGLPQPAAAFTFSAWADLDVVGSSATSNAASDRLLTADMLAHLASIYLDGTSSSYPLAAPVHGDYRGVCPLYLQVGGAEILLDDSVRVAHAARRAGVDVEIDIVPDMQHVFQLRAGRLSHADSAIARVSEWLRSQLDHRISRTVPVR